MRYLIVLIFAFKSVFPQQIPCRENSDLIKTFFGYKNVMSQLGLLGPGGEVLSMDTVNNQIVIKGNAEDPYNRNTPVMICLVKFKSRYFGRDYYRLIESSATQVNEDGDFFIVIDQALTFSGLVLYHDLESEKRFNLWLFKPCKDTPLVPRE